MEIVEKALKEHEAKKIRKREMIELERALRMSKDQLEKEKKEKRKKLDNLLKEKTRPSVMEVSP